MRSISRTCGSAVTKFALWVHLTRMQSKVGFDLLSRVTECQNVQINFLEKPGWHKSQAFASQLSFTTHGLFGLVINIPSWHYVRLTIMPLRGLLPGSKVRRTDDKGSVRDGETLLLSVLSDIPPVRHMRRHSSKRKKTTSVIRRRSTVNRGTHQFAQLQTRPTSSPTTAVDTHWYLRLVSALQRLGKLAEKNTPRALYRSR